MLRHLTPHIANGGLCVMRGITFQWPLSVPRQVSAPSTATWPYAKPLAASVMIDATTHTKITS